MKRISGFFTLVAVLAFCFGLQAQVWAQASLAAENCLNDVKVNIDGEEDTYTCIRDGMKDDQWYYVPNRPRLATKGKDKMPVFHLLKFQAKDPADPSGNTLVEGGIIQFAVKLAAPDGAIDQMKAAIAKIRNIKDPATIQLGALPISEAQVTIYSPDGDMITSEPQQPGIAPAFANQEIPFQIRFNKLGADVYSAMCMNGGGIPVNVTFTYNGLTPPLGFKITANWDHCFSHLSTDTKAKADFGCWWWGASVETSVSTTNEETLKKMGIKVEKIAAGEGAGGPTSADLQAVIDPILARIADTIAEDFKPYDKVEPAKANTPNPRKGAFFSGGVSFSLKAENKRKHGEEKWEWTEQQVVVRRTSCGSIIGIGHLLKGKDQKEKEEDAAKKGLITIMPAGNWAAAYYTLPAVGDDPSLGIKQISIAVVPVAPTKKDAKTTKDYKQIMNVKQEAAFWYPDTQAWTDKTKKNERTYLLFPMQGVYSQFKDAKARDELKYLVKLEIQQNRDTLKFEYLEDMIDGDIPVSTPLDLLETITVNCDWLSFAQKGDKEGLAGVMVELSPKFPNKKYTITLKGDSPTLVPCFLINREVEGVKNPIKANIQFMLVGGKKVAWTDNSLTDLRGQYPSLELFMWDKDWEVGKEPAK